MSRHEIGIDLIDIDRIHAVLGRFPDRFRVRVLTEREQRYCGNKVERIAGRWAAKEAISKVLGLGVRGVGWREIEILPNRAGAPQVYLHRRAAAPSGGTGPRGGDRLASRTSAVWRSPWRSPTAGTTEALMSAPAVRSSPSAGSPSACCRGPSGRPQGRLRPAARGGRIDRVPRCRLLTGLGALRAGAGLVTIAAAQSVAARLGGIVPELTWMVLDEEAPGLIAPSGWRRLDERGSGVRRGGDRPRARPPTGHPPSHAEPRERARGAARSSMPMRSTRSPTELAGGRASRASTS